MLFTGVVSAAAAGALALPAHGVVGDEHAGSADFLLKVHVGDNRGCTAVLLDAKYVLTAKRCFENGSTPLVAGPPPVASTVQYGTPGTTTAKTATIDYLLPHPDRDLVVAHLNAYNFGTRMALSTTAPSTGDTLQSFGFGRTATQWVPDTPHTGQFSVTTSSVATFDVVGTGTSSLCKGDAGAPIVRTTNGVMELVGIASTSKQGGCLGTTATSREATITRTDNVVDWIKQTIFEVFPSLVTGDGGADANGFQRWADFDGDGRADYFDLWANGTASVSLFRGGDARGGWVYLGMVNTGSISDPTRIRLADFNGDRRVDYIVIADSGAVNVTLNNGGDGRGGWTSLGQVAVGTTTDATRVRFADFNGDGKADYIVVKSNGAVEVTLNQGGDGRGGWSSLGQVLAGTVTDPAQLLFVDFDGDRKADYADVTAAPRVRLNQGGDGRGGWVDLGQVSATGANTTPRMCGSKPCERGLMVLADMDADGRADHIAVAADGPAILQLNRGGDGHGGWVAYGTIVVNAIFQSGDPSPGPTRPSIPVSRAPTTR